MATNVHAEIRHNHRRAFFTDLPCESTATQQKSPTRHLGAIGCAPSREERPPLRLGRVAWLTAFSAAYSGGTAADSHGLLRFPCLQIEI